MSVYRDGTPVPVRRDGTPRLPESRPAATATPQAALAPEDLPEPRPESGADKAWRGHEEGRVGAKNARPGAPAPLSALDDACVTTLIREVDLSSAAEALASAKIEAWVTVATPSGLRAIEIQDYLRRRSAT